MVFFSLKSWQKVPKIYIFSQKRTLTVPRNAPKSAQVGGKEKSGTSAPTHAFALSVSRMDPFSPSTQSKLFLRVEMQKFCRPFSECSPTRTTRTTTVHVYEGSAQCSRFRWRPLWNSAWGEERGRRKGLKVVPREGARKEGGGRKLRSPCLPDKTL